MPAIIPVEESIANVRYLMFEAFIGADPPRCHVCRVTVQVHEYLVFAFQDDTAPVNKSLLAVAPNYPWSGDLFVASCGKMSSKPIVNMRHQDMGAIQLAVAK
jgi:hypothetical protein